MRAAQTPIDVLSATRRGLEWRRGRKSHRQTVRTTATISRDRLEHVLRAFGTNVCYTSALAFGAVPMSDADGPGVWLIASCSSRSGGNALRDLHGDEIASYNAEMHGAYLSLDSANKIAIEVTASLVEADGFPDDRRLNDLLSDVQSDTLKEMETPFTYDAFQGDEGMHVQVRWMAIEDAE